MGKMHVWVGHFESRKSFEKYLDQKAYLEAWAAYDHGAPSDEEDDEEPDPVLRCAFCKEVDLDDYDEDALIMKYFQRTVGAERIAKDLRAGESRIRALFDRHGLNEVNALIAYEANGFGKASASGSSTVTYLGQIDPSSGVADASTRKVHHLWVGEGVPKLSKGQIVQHLGVARSEIVDVTLSCSDGARKLDETIAIEVGDSAVAEKMILAVDRLNLAPTARAVLEVILDGRSTIDGAAIGSVLGWRYIGKFLPG